MADATITKPIESYKDMLDYALQSTDTSKLSESQLAAFQNYLWELTVKAARDDFGVYARLMLPEMIPEYTHGRHIDVMTEGCQALYEAIRDNRKADAKLQVAVPPESSKTVTCSHLFPSWILGKHPKWRVIVVCHSGEHAGKEIGNPIKQIVQSQIFQEIFPGVEIADDMKANNFFKTNHWPGGVFAGGHGGRYPGKRANLLIADDINSEQDAPSERKTINGNYAKGLESRMLSKHSGQLIIQTRWNLDDLAGYTQERDKNSSRPWKVISIPGILETQEDIDLLKRPGDPEDRFVIGGSYWPEHKPIEDLLYMKSTWIPKDFAAVVQQKPTADEGNIFKKKSFRTWMNYEPPEVSHIIVSLDTAFSEADTKDSAESACSVWGIFPQKEVAYDGRERVVGNMILLNADKGYWSFGELIERCLSLNQEYGRDLDFFLVEDKASGKSLIQELRARGIPVMPYLPDRDKMARAWAASPTVDAGRVYVNPNLHFSQVFIDDVTQFPAAGKDMTDCFTQAVLWMVNNWHVIPEDYVTYKMQDEEDKNNVVKFNRPKSYWAAVRPSR